MKSNNKIQNKSENYQLGIVKNWNKELNNQICLILNIHNISYNSRYNFCKVLVGESIHTVPSFFIKKI